MNNPKSIRALFAMPGFIAASKLVGVFGDRYSRVIKLKRQKKQRPVVTAGTDAVDDTTTKSCGCVTSRWPDGESTWSSNAGVCVAQSVAPCM